VKTKTNIVNKGKRNPRPKLTERQVISIRNERATKGTTLRRLAEKWKVAVPTISHVVYGLTWKGV
jgi:hypothetical protein